MVSPLEKEGSTGIKSPGKIAVGASGDTLVAVTRAVGVGGATVAVTAAAVGVEASGVSVAAAGLVAVATSTVGVAGTGVAASAWLTSAVGLGKGVESCGAPAPQAATARASSMPKIILLIVLNIDKPRKIIKTYEEKL
jgi:hypothetical protein